MRNTLLGFLPLISLAVAFGAQADPEPPARAVSRVEPGPTVLPLPESGPRQRLGLAPDERISVYVVLEGRPAVEAIPAGLEPGSGAATAIVRRELDRLQRQHRGMERGIVDVGGRVEAKLMRLANAIQANVPAGAIERIARLPGVIRIDAVPRYERTLKSAVPFVGAPALWGNPGLPITGKGIRVGIVDTGVDYLHADFGGPGTVEAYQNNDRTVIEPGTFPTQKVLGGRDFVGDDYTGENSPHADEDPLDCARMQSQYIAGGHGTHVAGIVAGMGVLTDGTTFTGPYEASYQPSMFLTSPGVAPEASLYALKVFGCDGGTTMVAAALDWAVDPNDDGDLSDRLDVVNMSLGGSYGLSSPTDEKVVANIAKAGTLLVVAAGNDGNVFYTAGEPSTYSQVLSVAATTDVVTYLSLRIDQPSVIAGEVPCAEGAFTKPLVSSGVIAGQLVASVPANGCSAISNPEEIQGKIAFIDRGSCYFADKVRNAYEAGAIAVVVANNAAGEPPFSMGGDGGASSVIPGVMITKVDGDLIRPQLGQGVFVTLDPSNLFENSLDADQMTDFSSRGPRASDNRLKPDIAAPGLAIDSAGVGTGVAPREMSGTSMACPMAAGAAALVRQQNPGFGPFDVKAAMMNNTVPVTDANGQQVPMSLGGAGRIQVDRAAFAKVLAAEDGTDGAVSVSFGSIVTAEPVSVVREIVVSNLGDEPASLVASVVPSFVPDGVNVALDATTLEVPAKGTVSLGVTLSVEPASLPIEGPDPFTTPTLTMGGQPYARHYLTEASGLVTLRPSEGTAEQALRVPFHAVVRAASERKAQVAARCADSASDEVRIPLHGPSVHKEPLTTAFELMASSPTSPLPDPETASTDLAAVGVANNLATAASFEEAMVFFGLAVAGPWTTPARGQLSLVAIAIDTNQDQSPDFAVFAEPRRREGPYSDLLVAMTYNLATGEAVARELLNVVPPDVHKTEPFNNSVVILPVNLSAIGLTQAAAGFQFYAMTQGLGFPQTKDSTTWVQYDPTRAKVDTARGGANGMPFYAGSAPIKVHVDADLVGDGPAPSILLLHHTNTQASRWEVVDVVNAPTTPPGDLRIEVESDARVAQDGQARVSMTVQNVGSESAGDVMVEASISGEANLVEVVSSQGSCTQGKSVRCELGELAAGASANVELTVKAGAADVHVLASVGTSPDCDTAPGNNHASATVEVGDEPTGAAGQGGSLVGYRDRAIDAYDPGGGCACSTLGGDRGPAGGTRTALLGLALLGLAVGRRRSR